MSSIKIGVKNANKKISWANNDFCVFECSNNTAKNST